MSVCYGSIALSKDWGEVFEQYVRMMAPLSSSNSHMFFYPII